MRGGRPLVLLRHHLPKWPGAGPACCWPVVWGPGPGTRVRTALPGPHPSAYPLVAQAPQRETAVQARLQLKESRHPPASAPMASAAILRTTAGTSPPPPPQAPPGPPRARPRTAEQHAELLVEELGLPAGHERAGRALAHGVHEAHARQRHLLAAALVAEALSAATAVVLGEGVGR